MCYLFETDIPYRNDETLSWTQKAGESANSLEQKADRQQNTVTVCVWLYVHIKMFASFVCWHMLKLFVSVYVSNANVRVLICATASHMCVYYGMYPYLLSL